MRLIRPSARTSLARAVRLPIPWLVASVLAAASLTGAPAAAAGGYRTSPPALAAGEPRMPVPVNFDVSERPGSEVEDTIAANPADPRNVVAMACLAGRKNVDGLLLGVSFDGGGTWARRLFASGTAIGHTCDDRLAWDRYGNLWMSHLTAKGDVFVGVSTDGGRRFRRAADIVPTAPKATPSKAGRPDRYLGIVADQPFIAVGPGSVWVTYTSTPSGVIQAAGARVTGRGRFGPFTAPQSVPTGRGDGDWGNIAVGPRGQVMVTYEDVAGPCCSRVYTALDPDGLGPRGFGRPRLLARTRVEEHDLIPAQPDRGINADPMLAWDTGGDRYHGRVYAVWTQATRRNRDNLNVMFQYSDDDGKTWTKAVPLNDSETVNSQFLPTIAVDPATGDIAVGWYDCRDARGQGGHGCRRPDSFTQFWATYSTDGGAAFAPGFRVSQGTSSAPDAHGFFDYGDYTQAALQSRLFYPAWSDNSDSTGTNPNGRLHQLDVYTAPVRIPAGPAAGARAALSGTAPVTGQHGSSLTALAPGSRVQVSVFVGRDQAGLAAEAASVSNPASHSYAHFLTPAQVQAEFGATAAQQRAVGNWLARSGLRVTHRDAFTISARGTAARAESALRARLELSHPGYGAIEQVVSQGAMSVPAALSGTVTTVRVAPTAIPVGGHGLMATRDYAVPGSRAADKIKEDCPAYYGQKKAARLPAAYGRTLDWAPCGYLPQQLRAAYGAAKSGLTGKGVSVAVLSEESDSTALSDADRWARERGFPPFAPGQFSADVAAHVPVGIGDVENALDIEAVHGMAPAARVSYVAGNGDITGDRLLDALDTVVSHGIAQVVSSSWWEGWMPVPASMIDAWEGVLQRAAVEGITVNFATGDLGDVLPLNYPGSDPWVTTVGGTSLAIGAGGRNLWETGWENDDSQLSKNGTAWDPAPPGVFYDGSTGGVSHTFPEPYYQDGVVSGNTYRGKAMRDVPDVSAFGDPALGYQIGLSHMTATHKIVYVNAVSGGTSLSTPMFTGFEADLIQGRGGIALGFANPALYSMARTPAFHDVTGTPQGKKVTEADVYGPAYGQPPALSTMGQCSSAKHTLACGRGYDTVTGIGSPGPRFFSSFGSHAG